jgi:hypothetical protein
MSKFPDESGFYWHKNRHGLWEMVILEFSFGFLRATSCDSGRQFNDGEHGEFSSRIKSPDEDET